MHIYMYTVMNVSTCVHIHVQLSLHWLLLPCAHMCRGKVIGSVVVVVMATKIA